MDFTIDLGRDAAISVARLHTRSHTAWGIYYPSQLAIHVRRDGSGNWQAMGESANGPAQTSFYSTAWLGASAPVVGRHVRSRVTGAYAHFLVDEFEVWGTAKQYDVGVGKFYTFSRAPVHPDSYPFSPYADGSELTNETLGVEWPLTEWVGWWSATPGSIDVTVDLGRPRLLDQVSIHCRSHTAWGIYYSTTVEFRTSLDGAAWISRGSTASPTDSATYTSAWLAKTFPAPVDARYVRLTLNHPAGAHTQADELRIVGHLVQTWKDVDPTGAYNGAYSSGPDIPRIYRVDVPRHEGATNKTLAMAHVYHDMNPSFPSWAEPSFDSLHQFWNDWIGLGANDYDRRGQYRFLAVGWLPANMTAAQIAAGDLDGHLRQWFLDSMAHWETREHDRIWVRPMNEMNGEWTFPGNTYRGNLYYGGVPLAYRQAWRRIYNIAEKVGATEQLVFVFAPNAISWPTDLGNAPDQYYPGDGYVDWYGLSVYNHTPLPTDQIRGSSWPGSFNHQAAFGHKPMMVSEGAISAHYLCNELQSWINNWFDMKTLTPEVKGYVWYNDWWFTEPEGCPGDCWRPYDFGNLCTNAQDAFRARAQDPYWLE